MSCCFPFWSCCFPGAKPSPDPFLPPTLLSDYMVQCAHKLMKEPTDEDTMRQLSLLMVSMNIVQFGFRGHVFALAPVVTVECVK